MSVAFVLDGYYFDCRMKSVMSQPTFGSNGERALGWVGSRLVLFCHLPGLFEPLFSPVYKVRVLGNTYFPEQMEELEYSMEYQDWCSRTIVWGRRPVRGESFPSDHAITHSFMGIPLGYSSVIGRHTQGQQEQEAWLRWNMQMTMQYNNDLRVTHGVELLWFWEGPGDL